MGRGDILYSFSTCLCKWPSGNISNLLRLVYSPVCVCACTCPKKKRGRKTKVLGFEPKSRICLPMQELQEMWVRFLGNKDPPEEKWQLALVLSCLDRHGTEGAWWVTVHEVLRVGHDWATEHTCIHYAFYLEISLKIESCGLIAGTFPPFFHSLYLWKSRMKPCYWKMMC